MRNRISFLKKLSVLWMMILLTVSSLPLWAYAAESQGVDVAVEVQTLRKGDTPEEEKEFLFALEAEEGTPLPSQQTVTIRGTGTASFEAIHYTSIGEYHYTVTQKLREMENYTLDATVYHVTVCVMNQEKGNGLCATVDVQKNEETSKSEGIVYTNEYHTPKTPNSPKTPGSPGTPETNSTPNEKKTPVPTNTTIKTGTTPVVSQSGAPKTGDTTNMGLWLLMMAGALMIIKRICSKV